jgi:sirohydrochlorin ferrochelatase
VTRVVLLAHGSPDPRSAVVVRAAADQVAGRLHGVDVVAAFLDHDTPVLADAVGGSGSSDDVVVLPLLLSAAFHARVDVPAAVAALDRRVRLLEPLGHPRLVLDALLGEVVDGGAAVVVAAGTRVDAERAAFAEAVAASAARTGVTAYAAFATGPGPSLADALVPGAAVVPWLLAPGRLLDAVRAEAWGHEVLGSGLLERADLLDEIAARVGAGREDEGVVDLADRSLSAMLEE